MTYLFKIMDMSDVSRRKDGYYWTKVTNESEWGVVLYKQGYFFRPGSTIEFDFQDFFEVGRKVPQPDKQYRNKKKRIQTY